MSGRLLWQTAAIIKHSVEVTTRWLAAVKTELARLKFT